ncbi:MAG: formylmethanofuran dehydrogenase subunit B [Euryarchaeota archaeon]|nr:formylmethanofuran dehydrogenase subunit B [Euryarchaeota archaeon]
MESGRQVVRDVGCTVCGCLCDDIELVIERGRIVQVRHACRMGTAKFLHATSEERLRHALLREGGVFRRVELDEALDRAAEILADASRALLFGWSETSCEALRVGIKIAEEIGGIVDNCSSICHSPSILALQSTGMPACTLGEVKNRADLVIYWGANPLASHPRHLSRYSTFPRGYFRERGRSDRELVVVDVRRSETAEIADWFIQVEPNSDYEVLTVLRMLVRGREMRRESVGGVKLQELRKLAEKMKSCSFGVLFFGLGLASSYGKSWNVAAAIRLAAELNGYTKFAVLPMRGHCNVAGTNQVLGWQTGFPFAVDFSRGYPWYNPGETSVVDLLARREVDAMLVIGADPGAHLPRRAVERMAEIPLIAIDISHNPTTMLADVVIPGAVVGLESSGTCYRMDDVPVQVRQVIPPVSEVPSDEWALEQIYRRIRAIKGVQG